MTHDGHPFVLPSGDCVLTVQLPPVTEPLRDHLGGGRCPWVLRKTVWAAAAPGWCLRAQPGTR